jgi:hypothetical protein
MRLNVQHDLLMLDTNAILDEPDPHLSPLLVDREGSIRVHRRCQRSGVTEHIPKRWNPLGVTLYGPGCFSACIGKERRLSVAVSD